MIEIYRCLDGRLAQLRFNEDALSVSVTTLNAGYVGFFQFNLAEASGRLISWTDGAGQPALLKFATVHLDAPWVGQGIAERVVRLVQDQTLLPVASDLTFNR